MRFHSATLSNLLVYPTVSIRGGIASQSKLYHDRESEIKMSFEEESTPADVDEDLFDIGMLLQEALQLREIVHRYNGRRQWRIPNNNEHKYAIREM